MLDKKNRKRSAHIAVIFILSVMLKQKMKKKKFQGD